ncbi:MAG TPA: hypothetical protein PLX97_10895, partial [Gemmatales bacterium]|nr:hypothetical protein [Gemmatales bacterium]
MQDFKGIEAHFAREVDVLLQVTQVVVLKLPKGVAGDTNEWWPGRGLLVGKAERRKQGTATRKVSSSALNT